jgi:NitT/TauT family transport system permease protein
VIGFLILALLMVAALVAMESPQSSAAQRKPLPGGALLALVVVFIAVHLGAWWRLTHGQTTTSGLEAQTAAPLIQADPRVSFLIYVLDAVALLTAIVRFGGVRVRAGFGQARSLGLTAAFTGLLLIGWWFVTRGERVEDRIIAPIILPSPVEVLRAFPALHFDQALVRNAFASFARVTFGFGLAVLVAVPLGVYMGTFTPIAAFFRPLALVGAYVPIVVFIPLTIAWFGATEVQKVGFLFIVCLVALLPLVIKTIADVPAAYLDVAVTKGATEWQLVRHVLFPVAKADLWDHLRGVYGVGWTWIILAEVWANADQGLGYLLDLSNRRGHTYNVFAVAVVIVIIAVVCDQVWRYGGRLLFPYKRTEG